MSSKRMLGGRSVDDLSPSERERYMNMQNVIAQTQAERDKLVDAGGERGFQERAKTMANKKFGAKRPNAPAGAKPFPQQAMQNMPASDDDIPIDEVAKPDEGREEQARGCSSNK